MSFQAGSNDKLITQQSLTTNVLKDEAFFTSNGLPGNSGEDFAKDDSDRGSHANQEKSSEQKETTNNHDFDHLESRSEQQYRSGDEILPVGLEEKIQSSYANESRCLSENLDSKKDEKTFYNASDNNHKKEEEQSNSNQNDEHNITSGPKNEFSEQQTKLRLNDPNDKHTEHGELKSRRTKNSIKKSVNWCDVNEKEMERIKESRQLQKTINKIMFTLYVLAFLSSFSYWVQSGVLPYLTRRVGMNPELFGLMESSYALYQMITSPVYGRLGDIFGVRIIYMVSELSGSITFGSLAIADNVLALFLTRLPALFMHSVLCSYMIITDISTTKSRADLIGKLGVLHGVGMIFGSLAGGIVTHIFDEKTAAVVAAVSNLFSIFIIFVFIPNNTKQICYQIKRLDETYQNTNANHETTEDNEKPSLSGIIAVLKFRNMKYLLFIKILIAFPYSLLYSMFSMAVMDFYHLGPKINGVLLGYVGLLTIFVQGFLVGYLTKRYTDAWTVKTMICFNALGFLFLVVADKVLTLVIVVIPLAIGGSVSHIVLMTVITKIVPIENTGTALGLLFSLHAIVRAVAPTLGGLMFTNLGWPYFGVVGYVVHFGLVGYVLVFGRDDQYE